MDVPRRMYLIRVSEKIDKNKKYADKIGTKNNSLLKKETKKIPKAMKAL